MALSGWCFAVDSPPSVREEALALISKEAGILMPKFQKTVFFQLIVLLTFRVCVLTQNTFYFNYTKQKKT